MCIRQDLFDYIGYWRNYMYYLMVDGSTGYEESAYIAWITDNTYEVHSLYGTCLGPPHRLDGPAIDWEDGDYWWYINGIMYRDFKEFQVAGGLSDSDMMLLRLKYGEIGS